MNIRRKERCMTKRGISLILVTVAAIFLIISAVGSALAQEEQVLKEIRVQTEDGAYTFPAPILRYEGNTIWFHCTVKPINCYIKNGYLNISNKIGEAPLKSESLNITSNNIDEIVPFELKKNSPIGIYIASIDLVTTNNTNIPDAGAYVSLKVEPAGTPIVVKFEDLNGDGKFDENTEKGLAGWEFRVIEADSNGKLLNATTDVSEADGTIHLKPSAVGNNYIITEDPNHRASKGWESTSPKELSNGKYIVEEGEKKLYFANRLKPAILVLAKYEDRNGNDKFDKDEGLPNRVFQVTGPGFSMKVSTNSTGYTEAKDLVLPFTSVTGQPDD